MENEKCFFPVSQSYVLSFRKYPQGRIDMRSLSILLFVTQLNSLILLVTVLVLAFFECSTSSQSSRSTTSTLPGPTPIAFQVHHDIPPDIVINVGSFSIETDRSITNGTTNSTKRGTYKTPGIDINIMSIRIIRTDDGAILYQNFEALDAEIEFTTDRNKKITIKPGNDGKKNVEFESEEDENLTVQYISPPVNRRTHRLHNENYRITKVTVKKNNRIFFSHDTLNRTSDDTEYSDKGYKVFIRVE
jgi:hypothetical protein